MEYCAEPYRRRIIGPTLQHAARHPFYRAHWGPLAPVDSGEPDASPEHYFDALEALPCTRQTDLAQSLKPLLECDDAISRVSYSSGSTGGPKITVLSERDERLFESMSGVSLLAPSERAVLRGRDTPKPLTMYFPRMWNGFSNVDGATSLYIPGSVDNDIAIQRTREILDASFALPGYGHRIQVLIGTVESLRILTRYLMDIGEHASSFAINGLCTYGQYDGAESRRALTRFWKCRVIDQFSVSEMPRGGGICPRCGFIDFEKVLFPNVLHLTLDSVVRAGQGRLALTALLPSQSAQPLIKYLTGDLVEWIAEGSGCPEHVGGIRRLGRKDYSIVKEVDGGPIVLLGSQDLHDALDAPGVCRAHPHLRISAIQVNDIYPPRCSVHREDREDGSLSLEVRYRPERPNQVACDDFIRERLLRVNSLRVLVETGEVVLHVKEDRDGPSLPWKFG